MKTNSVKGHAGTKGKLLIVAGYAPGTGKTYFACTMAAKLAQRGNDVVVGYLNRQRPELASILRGFENFRPVIDRPITHNEALLDVKSVIKRAPDIALVDELALPNAFIPGKSMYEGILELVYGGISVITTVNLQKFYNINLACAAKTGLKQKTVIPDRVLTVADKILFLNQPPEVIRRRFIEGRLFSPRQMQREFLQKYMALKTLERNRAVCLKIISQYKNAEIIDF